jgi:hypothetical protein
MPESKASRNRVICGDRPVPNGWVVVGHYHNPACEGDGANALIVKRAGRREVVCADSPIPDGYRELSPTHSESCPGDGDNARLIERIEDGPRRRSLPPDYSGD